MNAGPAPCAEREMMLHGLADGELDAVNTLAAENHLRECSACAAAFEAIERQKALLADRATRFQAPPALRGQILDALAAEQNSVQAKPAVSQSKKVKHSLRVIPFGRTEVVAAFSAMTLAASLILFVNVSSYSPGLDQQLVASHVRSLLASHLTDVASSDQHTVKPWFLGKLDFAPPVPDLAKEDFPLIGGRLDYVGGRVTPSLVYRRRGHTINLFLQPAGQLHAAGAAIDGYHVLSWSAAGFDFAAVSDLNPAELQAFANAFVNAVKP
jgi:anti-sigma factor RsiW